MMNTLFSTSVGLDAAKNSNSNEEWITIHPNNAKEGKGQPIKIDKGNGEIIGGNPHLVKALGEKGAKVDPEAAKVDEPGFAVPKDEDFADILGDEGNAEPSFSTPSENVFSELFEDDTHGFKQEHVETFVSAMTGKPSVKGAGEEEVKKVVSAHPEWFNQVDGKLTIKGAHYADWCNHFESLSNPAKGAEEVPFKDLLKNTMTEGYKKLGWNFDESYIDGIVNHWTAVLGENYISLHGIEGVDKENLKVNLSNLTKALGKENADLQKIVAAYKDKLGDDVVPDGFYADEQNGAKPAEPSSEKSFEDIVTETLKEHANKKGLNIDEATLDSWKSKIMTALSGWASVEIIKATLDNMTKNLGTENEGLRDIVSAFQRKYGDAILPDSMKGFKAGEPLSIEKAISDIVDKMASSGAWADAPQNKNSYVEQLKSFLDNPDSMYNKANAAKWLYDLVDNVPNDDAGLKAIVAEFQKKYGDKVVPEVMKGGSVTEMPKSPFPEAAVKQYLSAIQKNFEFSDNELKGWAKAVEEHPELFEVGNYGELKVKEGSLGKLEKFASEYAKTAKEGTAQPSPFTDEQIKDYIKKDENGISDIEAEGWKKAVVEHPEWFKTGDSGNIKAKDSNYWKEIVKFVNNYVKSASNGTEQSSPFTDEQINAFLGGKKNLAGLSDVALEGWKKAIKEHPEWFATTKGGALVAKATDVGKSGVFVADYIKIAKNVSEGNVSKYGTNKIVIPGTKITNEMIKEFSNGWQWSDEKKAAMEKAVKEHPELVKIHEDGETIEAVSPSAYKELQFFQAANMPSASSMNAAPSEEQVSEGQTTTQQEPVSEPYQEPVQTPMTPEQLADTHNVSKLDPSFTTKGEAFPQTVDDLKSLSEVKALGGASGANATLYVDANGNQYVMKRFDPSDAEGQKRIAAECLADSYYMSGGANIPAFKLYGDEKSGYVKLSKFIPGTKTLGQVWSSASPEMKTKIQDGLKKNFALDVMAGAWDVLGEGRDNVLVDNEGNVWRADNGGAFEHRAQGGVKSMEQWGSGHIDDLWTMRGLSPNLDGTTVPDATGKKDFFGGITTHQLLSDIASRDWDKIIAHLPDGTKSVMQKRIANAKEYHAVCDDVVKAGGYGDGKHAEDITLNYHGINKFGAKIGCTNQNVGVVDPITGKQNWGWCRGDVGDQAPKFSQFFNDYEPKLSSFTGEEEPKIEQFAPSSDQNFASAVLAKAGVTINHHLAEEKDGSPNEAAINAALELKPKLASVAIGSGENAKQAQKMLSWLEMIENMKNEGWKNLEQKIPFSPSGPLDLQTPEVKKAAEESFKKAHAEWENKVKSTKSEFDKAKNLWDKKKLDARKKFDSATQKWQSEHGANAFKWNNLSECYEDFCKQNGIDSSVFWAMASDQGFESWKKGSCQMKTIELVALGYSFDDIANDAIPGVALKHVPATFDTAKEFKSNQELFEKHYKAYIAMKSLTQMLLRNSTFPEKLDDGSMLIVRTEADDVIDMYGIKKGVASIYPVGPHESFGSKHKVTVHGTHKNSVAFKVPFSRISSLAWLEKPGVSGLGMPMYCDSEMEAGANVVGIPGVLVSSGPQKVKDYKTALYEGLNGSVMDLVHKKSKSKKKKEKPLETEL